MVVHATANCNGDLGQSLHLAAKTISLSPCHHILRLEIQAAALASLYLGHLHSIFPNSGL